MGHSVGLEWVQKQFSSELAKLGIIMFLSFSLSKRKDVLQSFTKGLLPYLILVGFVAGLVVIEPHLSGTLIIVITSFILLFCAGAKISHFVAMAAPVIIGVVGAILAAPYRFNRVLAWLHPLIITRIRGGRLFNLCWLSVQEESLEEDWDKVCRSTFGFPSLIMIIFLQFFQRSLDLWGHLW